MFDDSQPRSRSVTLRLGSDHFFDLTGQRSIVPDGQPVIAEIVVTEAKPADKQFYAVKE